MKRIINNINNFSLISYKDFLPDTHSHRNIVIIHYFDLFFFHTKKKQYSVSYMCPLPHLVITPTSI